MILAICKTKIDEIKENLTMYKFKCSQCCNTNAYDIPGALEHMIYLVRIYWAPVLLSINIECEM